MSIYITTKVPLNPTYNRVCMSVSSKAMEGEEQEEHLNEAEPPESAGEEAGTTAGAGRFYECVFCKRGFSTAQALGGHMNIHRRDRANIRPARSSPGPRRADEPYHPYSREQRRAQPQAVESSSSNYAVYFPGSSSTSGGGDNKRELVLAGEELQLGLGGPGEEKKEEEKGKEVGSEDLDLDLELRLGHSKGRESSGDQV